MTTESIQAKLVRMKNRALVALLVALPPVVAVAAAAPIGKGR